MTSLSKTDLKDAVNKNIKVCKNGVFNVKHIDADVQFECMQNEFEGSDFDIVDADDHEEEVERVKRAGKQGIRRIAQGFPLKRTPMSIVRRLVEVTTRNLITFPAENGTFDALSLLSMTELHHPILGHAH